ncbi:tenascin isoform X6 [Mobula birostris]|uniref:tenascin isoform X6 n=1 Tax=Mobula birostris TaxID=1983395 RepID=UPI003B286452
MGLRWHALVCVITTILLEQTHGGLIKKIIRQKRDIPPPKEENATLPFGTQPINFNHVYNINVPLGSLCSVDLESPDGIARPKADSSEQHIEHTADGENQIVFTHRINIPRQACGCAAGPDIRDLLSRLEALEGHVSSLRQQCANGGCCENGAQQGKGRVDVKPFCGAHGNYSTHSCGCLCNPGWKGENCSEPDCPANCNDRGTCIDGKCVCDSGFTGDDCGIVDSCPNDCSDQGRCINGACHCFEGYAGEDCSQELCPNNCSGQGICVDGKCVCDEGLTGEDCKDLACLNNCYNRGRCVDGECICDEGFTDVDCSEIICPKDCYDRGRCIEGVCYCDEGFTGEDCGELVCLNNCSNSGLCVNGQCVCNEGYTGEDCSELACLNNCNNQGVCVDGECICHEGFTSEDCGELACPNSCHDRGRCVNGRCICDEGFAGEDCGQLSCPNDCSNHGICVNGQCVCDHSFTGEDCSELVCPNNCNNRGSCVSGQCICKEGYKGEDCGELTCPNECYDRGRCVNGRCVCDEGFAGEDCGQLSCPNDCSNNGVCINGQCVCNHGFTGEDCGELVCPNNCNNRGRCVNGQCVCNSDYRGIDCGERACPNNCNERGRCVEGQCICNEGYVNEDCSAVSPPKNLQVTEVTPQTVDVEWQNEVRVNEYLITYVPTSPGGLQLELRVPGDQMSSTIRELEPGIEYLINVYAILNNERSIPVSARVATHLPTPDGLKFKSIRETSVEVEWDPIEIGFDGWEMIFKAPKEDNGEILNSLEWSEVSFVQTGLAPGEEYEVSLHVVKNNTRGPAAKRKLTTMIDAPSQVEVNKVTDTTAHITWRNPAAHIEGISLFYGTIGGEKAVVDLPDIETTYSIAELQPDTEYEVSLVSKRGDMKSVPATNIFTTDLDPPRNLQNVSQTEDSITLQWKNSRAGATDYKVKFSPLAGGEHMETTVQRSTQRATTIKISDLLPGTEYGFGVSAIKDNRESAPATINVATDLDSPKDLTVTKTTENTITVEWKRPLAVIDRYYIIYISSSGERNEEMVPAEAVSYILSGLQPAAEYTIILIAQRGKLKSSASTTSASTEPLDNTTAHSPSTDIAKPENLVVTNVTSTSFRLSWAAHIGAFDSFLLIVKDVKGSGRPLKISRLPGQHTADIQGLVPGTDYTVDLYGVVQGHLSQPLTEIARTDSELDNLTVSDVTSGSLRLSWTAGGPYENLVVEIKDSDGLFNPQVYTLPGDQQSLDIPDLPAATDYEISLHGIIHGQPTKPLYTEAHTASKPEISNLMITNLTSDGFTVSWTANGAFESFVVDVTDPDRIFETSEHNVSGNLRSIDITKLSASTDYVIYLTGLYQGQHMHTFSAVATTEADPEVSNLVVSDITANSFSLSWTGKDEAFESFVIELIDSDRFSDPLEYTVPGSMRNTELSNLIAGTNYVVYLYGIANGRRTNPVTTVALTEEEPELDSLVVSEITSEGFTLSWTAEDGAFEYFIIDVKDSENSFDPIQHVLSGKTRTTDISGLVEGTGYQINITGVTEGWRTQPLTAVTATEEKSKMENLVVSNINSYGFKVSWNATDGAYESFIIVVRDSGRLLEPMEHRVSGNQRSITITGLITGIDYDINIYGVAKGQHSKPLFTRTATEAEPEVDHLNVSEVTSNGFKLSWTTDDNPFDYFNVTVSDSKDEFPPLDYRLSGDLRTTDIQGLQDGTKYNISLVGVTEERQSQPIITVAITGVGSPKHLEFSDVTDTTVLVRWELPRAHVDNFKVIYEPTDGGESTIVTVEGSRSQTVLRNLTPATQYQIRVVSVKEFQDSEPTSGTVRTALDSPFDLRVLNATESGALLAWKPSIVAVDEYVITYSADDGSPVTKRVSGNLIQSELSHLFPGTRYRVLIYAMKDSLRSSTSETSFTTAIDSPRDLTVSGITMNDALISWKPPRVQISGYILTIEAEDGKTQKVEYFGATERSYSLLQLDPSTSYNVKLQAYTGSERSSVIEINFITVGYLYPFPKDCSQTLLNGETSNGLQTIFLNGNRSQPLQVYCDMTTDGGGWMVFQRRENGEVDFFRKWKDYAAGFGDPSGEFWLGLENLHKITSEGYYELRVDLQDQGDTAYATYDKFSISDAKSRYKLHIGEYRGTAGDSLSYHQGRPFSTRDRDNDVAVTNCALSYKGAWWYKNCHRVNLNGKYGVANHSQGVNWYHWKGHEYSIEFVEMKLRPHTFRGLQRKKRAQRQH